MNLTLWIAQCLLAALFLATGSAKVFSSADQLANLLPTLPVMLVRFIGVSELLGAIGVILPAATRIQPRLTMWAAIGLGTIMILATLFHLSRAEYSNALGTVAILAGAAFVAYGRGIRRPVASRAARMTA